MSKVFLSLKEAVESPTSVSYFMGREGNGLVSKYGGKNLPGEFTFVRQADKIPVLDEVAEEIIVKQFTPPSEELLGQALGIFLAAYRKWRSEFIVLICWDKDKKEYYLATPKFQLVSGGICRYKQGKVKGVLGTIHSHGGGGPFFSGEDDKYEKGDSKTPPGIYMVMGGMASKPSYVARLAGMGMEKDIIELLPDEIKPVQCSEKEFEKKWAKMAMEESTARSKNNGWYIVDAEGQLVWWTGKKKEAEALAEEGDDVREAKAYVAKYSAHTHQNRGIVIRNYGSRPVTAAKKDIAPETIAWLTDVRRFIEANDLWSELAEQVAKELGDVRARSIGSSFYTMASKFASYMRSWIPGNNHGTHLLGPHGGAGRAGIVLEDDEIDDYDSMGFFH